MSGPIPDNVVVVVPAFNEQDTITAVVEDLLSHFSRVVCVDDGSRDSTAQRALRAGAYVLSHPFNLGQGAALATGIVWCLQDPDVRAIVTFDADGQHLAIDVVAAYECWRTERVDVVLGSRFLNEKSEVPPAKLVMLRVATSFTRFTTGLPVTDTHNGLRVLGRKAAGSLRLRHSGMTHASELLSDIQAEGLTWREVPVEIVYTPSRRGGQSVWNSVNIFFDLVWRGSR